MSNPIADDLAAIMSIDAVQKILEVVCRTTGLGFSAVARVTEDRWVACAVRDEIAFGLEPGGELRVETTICDEIRDSHRPVVIDQVAKDERFCGHPTPAMYGFQSYISVPIIRGDGRFFGTLCAIDPQPARVSNPETLGMFTLFAELIAMHLDAHERLRRSETSLRDERETAELRDQFIAVLGHDLRNPLASIQGGAHVLLQMPLDEKAAHVAARIQRSSQRMGELVENVLDFARGRLGGGFPVTLAPGVDLTPALDQVIAELQSAWPQRGIHSRLSLRRCVTCDSARIAQLFSNLLGNALVHGDPHSPVRIRAFTEEESFTLSVANCGEPLSSATMARLFQPFSRSNGRTGQGGLGLGLYIAAEIARAHGGTLDAASTPDETRFTFRMPCGSPHAGTGVPD